MRRYLIDFFSLVFYGVPDFLNFREIFKRIIVKIDGGERYSQWLRNHFEKTYNVVVGYATGSGAFRPENMPRGDLKNAKIVFGNYCSIARNIRIFRANHPINSFTSHPLLYNPTLGGVEKYKNESFSLFIGHDVWIGEWAIILPTVRRIGNGAVIGAGSVVTKDVPAYSVVAGNPAKLIRMRFSEEVIKEIEESQWWLWNKDELLSNKSALENIVNRTIG